MIPDIAHGCACMQEPEGSGSHRPRKVCLLGDTSDSRAIAHLARGCDLLSHESTFLDEMADKARLATHSTGKQAGQFAALVKVLFHHCVQCSLVIADLFVPIVLAP